MSPPTQSVNEDGHQWWRWRGQTLELDLRVQPWASRDCISGPLGQRLKVTITAPPLDGKANNHLCRYLAKAFNVPTSKVSVAAGHGSREKRIHIASPRQLPAALTAFIKLRK